MQITRDQVAKKARVSSATVSRVFNNPESVSPPLREAVLQAARSLGYTPNKVAGLLRRKGTGVIAFVELVKEQRPYYWGNLDSFDWFFGRSLRGIQEAIKDTTWQLRFCKVGNRSELEAIESQCDGILAYDVDTSEEMALFASLSVPSVLSHHCPERMGLSTMRTDNYVGGTLQGDYLKSHNCTNPLYITGYLDTVQPHRQRLEGFLSVFPNAQVVETTIGSPDAIARIYEEVVTYIQQGSVDSFAAVNDLTLFELLLTSKSSLPSVGYDASPFYRLFSGPVASVDIQSGDIYRRATSLLLSLIGGSGPENRVVVPRLVELCS